MSLCVLSLILLVAIFLAIRRWLTASSSNKLLPPGPHPLPIIGNLHHLGKNPHRSLAKLSEAHGPLMHLKLGSQHAIVVSSPEAARAVLQRHDRACSGRHVPDAIRAHEHPEWSLAWARTGARWLKFRKICKEEVFSKPRLVSTEPLRREKINQMFEFLNRCCDGNRAVNIGEIAYVTTLNMMSNTLFSMDFADYCSDSFRGITGLMRGLMRTVDRANLSDYFPILRRFDPQGIRRRTGTYFVKFFAVFDDVMSNKL